MNRQNFHQALIHTIEFLGEKMIKRLIVVAGMAIAAPFAAMAQECLTNLRLTPGRDTYDHSLGGPGVRMVPVGTFEADRGGAWGSDPNQRFDQNWVSLTAQFAPMAAQNCITEITTYAAPWGSRPTWRSHQQLVGSWDTDSGGSNASAGGGGDVLYSLAFARMSPGSQPSSVITDIVLRVGDTNALIIPPGYNWVGNWDTKNAWMATLSWRGSPYTRPTAPTAVMTGRWEPIASCTSASRCSEVRTSTMVGSDKSVSNAEVNTQRRELSIMVGAEVQTDSGKLLPGASVIAKMEVTGTLGEETSRELSNSLNNSRQETVEVACAGQASAWLWVSSIRLGETGMATNLTIRDRNYVCAGPNDQPWNATDLSWGLNFGTDEWTRVASENQQFTLSRPSLVRFGVGSRSTVRSLPAGTYTCNSSGWGGLDPAPGTVKSCERPREWVRCAVDFGTCNWSGGGARQVRYGLSGTYVTLDSAASGLACQPSSFGGRDPVPGRVKRCWYKVD